MIELLRSALCEEALLFFAQADDANAKQHTDGPGLAPVADVSEQTIRIGDIARQRRAELVSRLDRAAVAADDNRAAVRDSRRGVQLEHSGKAPGPLAGRPRFLVGLRVP